MPRKRTSGGERTCFVLMPFSAEFDAVYESAIRPAVASSGHFSCSRADDVFGPRPIMADILRSIQRADLLVADLTGRNPNVLYELGLAHAIQKPAILISQSIDDVPFDLRAIRCLVYRSDRHLRDDLKERLAAAIREYLLDSQGSSERIADYIVFSPVSATSSSKEANQQNMTDIDASDPAKQLAALRTLKDASRTSSTDQPISPSIVLSVAHYLESSHPEIQIAAIECLGRLKAKAYSHKLYPLIELPNPEIQKAAIEAITNLHDRNAEDVLIRVLNTKPSYSIKKHIIEALSKIGYELSTNYFSMALHDGSDNDPDGIGTAIKVLCGIATFESLNSVLSLDLNRLDMSNKILLAKGLGEAESLSFHQDRAAEVLGRLIREADPTVRGAGLAAWCLQSNSKWGGELPRQAFWQKVRAADNRTIRALFAGLVMYDNPFLNGEGLDLVDVGERVPDLGDQIVYYLSHIGGPEVSAFMKKWLPQERLWVLSYFARCPSVDAAAECEMEVRRGSDIVEKFLAMVCLARLGSSDAADNVKKMVGREHLYPWVRKYALPVLHELAGEASPASRRSLNKLISEIESE